jgi:hypothetical protein
MLSTSVSGSTHFAARLPALYRRIGAAALFSLNTNHLVEPGARQDVDPFAEPAGGRSVVRAVDRADDSGVSGDAD